MEESVFDLHVQNLKKEHRIVAGLEKISRVFRVLLWEESKKTGLSPIQIQILVFILFHPGKTATVTKLASEFQMTKATLSDSVKILELKKLVSRKRVTPDKRSFQLTLTKRGKTVAQSGSIFANVLQTKVQSLAPSYKASLLDSLLEVIYLLDRSGLIAAQRMCKTCRFFEPGKTDHYCILMKRRLHKQDLRLDCPEHEAA